MSEPLSTRALLEVVATGEPRETVTLDWLLDEFRARAFGVLLLAATLLSFIPLPVGVGAVAGPLVSLVGVQLLVLLPHPWLPGFLLRRGVRRGRIQRFRDRMAPWLARLERVSRPRAEVMFTPSAKFFTGLLLLVLGILLALPIPLTNYPFGLVLLAFCVALIERDGVVLAVAWCLGLIEIAACIVLSNQVIRAIEHTIDWMRGLF
ncbi:exopolysaccharide biosynthesis protein [Coralloluteibacterium stylophorae]|uniref:Exopolysaccharide biosynthesis protein n=1 Tax=Coralloluteibacterium stylophorae TaxID=1776034 RepID=A0A8J8AX29_9GAMM|nr:exopolysaccharide biosynthesis protein [Coralloluteibacterium stylophorae]MBS7456197.1 exopolysaccharide biosynthesis protein [Coralloluteibacterium stylophorae]